MDNPNEPVTLNQPVPSSGMGGKIAIIIILLVLLAGAWYFFKGRTADTASTAPKTADETESLNKELDTAASADIDADLKKMDQEFSQ